jgi:hypothetical protein
MCMIKDQYVVKKYLYIAQVVNWVLKNMKFKTIYQHMNATCQMKSLKNDFNLCVIDSLYHIFTHW